MNNVFFSALILGSASLSGCSGRVVDLDRESSGGAPAHVDRVVLDHASDPIASQLSVDDSRLYWSTWGGKMQSCAKRDCAHTVLTYASGAEEAEELEAPRVSASGGRVFWKGTSPNETILSCPISGCTASPTRIYRDSRGASGLLSDAAYVYWASKLDLYRCQSSGCGATPELVATGQVLWPRMSGNDVYWISFDGAGEIRTAPKDGSGPIRVLVSASRAPTAFAVNARTLFWKNNGNQLLSCPLPNCSEEPTLVQDNDGSQKVDLFADDTRLYWRNEANFVQTCAIADCTAKTVSSGVAQSFAVDAESVYWTDVSAGREFLGLNLHRVAKSEL